jgi:hypothetical protein
VWPSDIPGTPPLALLVTNRFDVRPDDPVTNEFIFPNEIELFSGGTFGENASFYASLTLLDENEFGGLHRLFGQFDSIKGSSFLNFKFGGFESRSVPFSSHRRLLKANYLMNDLQAGLDAALTGDLEIGHAHGGGDVFSFSTAQRGVEVWGAKNSPWGGGFAYAFGVVNGNGLGGYTVQPEPHGDDDHGDGEPGDDDHGDDDHGTPERDNHQTSFLDNNSRKDVYWRASYKLFGMGLMGSTGPGAVTIQETNNWVDNSLRIGTFGVRGQTRSGENLLEDEDFLRYGVDIDLWYKNLNLFGAYVRGHNERPAHDGLLEFDTNSWFLEADYVLLPWIFPALRYEVAKFDPVKQAGVPAFDGIPSIRRIVPHVTLLVRANVKLVFEANHFFDNFATDLFRFDIDFAF